MKYNEELMTIQELFDAVREWGKAKGIIGEEGTGTLLAQLSKTQEELTETRDAAVEYLYSRKGMNEKIARRNEIADGIGDTIVTLILAADLVGLTAEYCLQGAYDEIKGRTGRMVDGKFVKD